MTRKKRRLYILLLCAIGLGSATALTLTAFEDNLVFFRSPSDILAERPAPDRAFRLRTSRLTDKSCADASALVQRWRASGGETADTFA